MALNLIDKFKNDPRFRTREQRKREYKRLLFIVMGALVYSFFMNNFIVPSNLYSGGFMGTSQIIRTLITRALGVQNLSFDFAGVINFCFNIPLYIVAYRSFSKMYLLRGFVFLAAQTFFLSIVPVPSTPIIRDMLTCAIIGGVGCGLGGGMVLRSGANGGGMDMVGSILIRKYENMSISLISNTVNIFVFGVMMILFGPSRVIYSAIFSFSYAMTTDKVFIQNITTEVHVIVDEEYVQPIQEAILEKLNRGVTKWGAVGGYTGGHKEILYTIVSKYEVPQLRSIVRMIDPHALVVENAGVRINGNFEKRIE